MRISGVELRKDKRVVIALRYIYGIGATIALKLCIKASIPLSKRVKDLTTEEGALIQKLIEDDDKLIIEGELKRKLSEDLRRKISMKLIKGIRRMKGLPVNGQRTHTNGKTASKLGGIK
jgi:small subunit ribosomal protein S13